MIKINVPNFYTIPARIMHDKELSNAAKLLYAVLAAGNEDLTDDELDDFLKPHPAEPALKELLEAKYIAINMKNKKRSIIFKK